MIKRESFAEEHIRALQKNSKRDPILIERTIYAFGLLEAITKVEMPFIFKGGTCLMLLLEYPQRLSTDIDIIVEPGTDVEEYIRKAAEIFPFVRYQEQIRIGKNNIEKRHFKFTYLSPVNKNEFYILLDVLYEENHYERIIQKEIKNDLVLADQEFLKVRVPSIECILGDKLTAFAPHTTGIPLNIGKDMEVMKQLYDVSTLIDVFENIEEVKRTYYKIVVLEIAYRGLDVSALDCLKDTFDAALCIVSRGKYIEEEYPLYVSGIRDLRGHIYSENYNPEIAVGRAAKIVYLVTCLRADVPFERVVDYSAYISRKFKMAQMLPATYLRKVDMEAYAYMIKADELLAEVIA
ncbi:MAG: nucleotidyl transferase AbiEii/AbiGii toxin family protein [Eubacteriales bacterium]